MREEPVILVSEISKSYRKVRALRDLDLTVNCGTSFSLLGPNGAGKTTLMKILLGLVRPDSGKAFLSDHPVSSPLARKGVRFLPESVTFPDWASPAILFKQLERIRGEASREDFDRRCTELDCIHLIDRPVGKMSRGQRQRVALSMVTAGSPSLVFLDEPSSGLDPAGRILVRNLIRRLSTEGSTVMINSHLLGEVERTCDRAAFISEGRLMAEGDIDTLSRQKGLALVSTADPDPMRAALSAMGFSCRPAEKGITADLPDPSHFPALTASVVETGIGFTGVTLLREDLEEVFLRIMGEQHPGDGSFS